MEGGLAIIFVAVVVIGSVLKSLRGVWAPRRSGRYRSNSSYKRGPAWENHNNGQRSASNAEPTLATFPPKQNLSDPRDQLSAVSRVGFEPVPLLNRSEARLLPLLESIVRSANSGHRVMAQTSLGEVIRPSNDKSSKEDQDAAYASINSKRLDFAVIDRFGILRLAVEYQGHGHYRETSFMRDAVKREALRKAGIPLLEIAADFRREDVIRDVCQRLDVSNPSEGRARTSPDSRQSPWPKSGP